MSHKLREREMPSQVLVFGNSLGISLRISIDGNQLVAQTDDTFRSIHHLRSGCDPYLSEMRTGPCMNVNQQN